MSAPSSIVGRWTDSHCHIQEEYLGEASALEGLLERAAAAGIARAICIGTGERSSRQALALARHPAPLEMWASVGLHPHDATDGTAAVAALATDAAPALEPRPAGSLVAIGECGLDYFYDNSPRDVQQAAFCEQIALARRLGLTLVVHTRDAWEDTLKLLAAGGAESCRTVIHCFTGGPQEARRCLDLGAYLSFSGIVTFKNADPVRAAARLCPAERLLVETDSPFLAPVPHRGTPNEPALVAVVGTALAELVGRDATALAEQTSANAAAAFALPPLA